MGRHADPEPLRQGERPAHAVEGHVGLDGGAHHRRGGDPHAERRPGKDRSLHPRPDDFSIAAFKGQKLTFRKWNQQLRQPIFLGDGRSVVSISPQEGFLHQVSELDTLGFDQPETQVRLK